jgi:transcriptional regulator with XRE-family HTH domain
MSELNRHWTERSLDDFLYRVGEDFVRQLESAMQNDPDATRASLAKKLGVSKGRISQVLNNPGNLTLRKMIEYARAVGQKISVLAYSDGDSDNVRGPVSAEIFTGCWELAGKPTDFLSLNEHRLHFFVIQGGPRLSATDSYQMVSLQVRPSEVTGNTSTSSLKL